MDVVKQIAATLNGAGLTTSLLFATYSMQYLIRGKDYLFNLAGQTSHLDSMINPGPDLEINCRAQLSILEACRACNPEIKIIFASTRQIYGLPTFLPASETHPLNPVDVNKPLRETIESTLNYYREFISRYV